jgi:hypothetical protein
MKKLSNAQKAQVLQDASFALRTMAAERDVALAKVAQMERRADAEKLAAEMHNKGLELDTEFGDLASGLEKAADEGRLPVIQQAVEMVAPNMDIKVGSVSDQIVAEGPSQLERFLVGDVG